MKFIDKLVYEKFLISQLINICLRDINQLKYYDFMKRDVILHAKQHSYSDEVLFFLLIPFYSVSDNYVTRRKKVEKLGL